MGFLSVLGALGTVLNEELGMALTTVVESALKVTEGVVRDIDEMISDTPPKFEYTPLESDSSSIRLLKVLRGSTVEVLRCSLTEFSLDKSPEFDALSYTWEADEFTWNGIVPTLNRPSKKDTKKGSSEMILCNGRKISVQKNLHKFLLKCCDQKIDRYIWVDAICIDQGNETEKGCQMNLMGSLYGRAKFVVVWLGESTIAAEYGLRLMKDRLPRSIVESPLETDAQQLAAGILPMMHMLTGSSGLYYILGRGYFQRTWVMQGIIMAKKLCFLVGSTQITKEELLSSIDYYSDLFKLLSTAGFNVLEHFEFASFPKLLKAREDYQKGDKWPLEDYISLSREHRATESEGKVFGVPGLVEDAERAELNNPAKKKSVPETEKGCEDLPSWVPDYSVPHIPKSFSSLGCPKFQAAVLASPLLQNPVNEESYSESEPRTLNLSAAYCDTIEQVAESHDAFNALSHGQIKGHILDLMTKLGKYYRPTGEHSVLVCARVLTADLANISHTKLMKGFVGFLHEHVFETQIADSKVASAAISSSLHVLRLIFPIHEDKRFKDSSLSVSKVIDAFIKQHEDKDHGIDLSTSGIEDSELRTQKRVASSDFETPFNIAYKDRRIFRTRNKGYVGIGPSYLGEGDKIMLVAGGDTPFIFRDAGNGKLRLVGSAFVHGMMYGEALKLPDLKFRSISVI